MAITTLPEWEKADHSRYSIHRQELQKNGQAKVTFMAPANHHAFFAEFAGKDAVKAVRIWGIGRARAALESAKADVLRLEQDLADLLAEEKPPRRKK